MIASGTLGDVRLITGGYLQDWLLYDTDWSWRLEREQGGDLRVIGDIGSHWLDLTSFLTGRRVDAVMADLTTFMPVRSEPVGHVETFSTVLRRRRPATARSRPRTRPACSCASRAARAASYAVPGLGRAEDHLHWEIDGCRRARLARRAARGAVGRPPRPRQRAAAARPRPLAPPAAAPRACPPAMRRASARRSASSIAPSTPAVAAGEPPAEPDYPTFADGHEQSLVRDAIARSHAEAVGRGAALTGVIFDCDGTLVDSEPLSGETWRRVIAPYGYAITDADLEAVRRASRTRTRMRPPPSGSRCPAPDAAAGELNRVLFGLIDDAARGPSTTRSAVEELRARDVASRSRPPRCGAVGSHAGPRRARLRGHDRRRRGRARQAGPDMSCSRRERLGLPPERCVVVEDSPPGVAAGRAAGCRRWASAARRVPVDLSGCRHEWSDDGLSPKTYLELANQ